jgi:hypothetical protein
MKKIVLGVLVVIAMVFTSCLDDDGDYSLGDMWVGFGVLTGDEPGSYNMVMDNGDKLVPVASNSPGWQNRFDSGDRVLVNYTILDDDTTGTQDLYYVKVNEIDDILMKGIMELTPENADSIGNDPIIVEEYWMTDSLLSFKLKYWGGYGKVHYLNLVREEGDLSAGDQPFQLELRHNANDDQKEIQYTAFVSFSLNSLRLPELDSVSFEFSSTDYEGTTHSNSAVFNYEDLELP